MVNMAGKRLLGALIMSAMAGCAITGSPAAHPQASIATQHVGTAATESIAPPPFQPCFQLSRDDLLTLEQFSDVVVQATIDTPAVPASTGGWFTRLSKVTVLSQKSTSALPAVQTLIDNGDPSSYRHPGTYILFLSNDPGSTYYVITGGLDGTFKINGSSITRECPNYGGTAPILATAAAAGASAVTTVADLKALIPASLPLYSPPSKPTVVPSAPPTS